MKYLISLCLLSFWLPIVLAELLLEYENQTELALINGQHLIIALTNTVSN